MSGIYTCYVGSNDLLIKNVCDMYVKNGADILDMTFGTGAFWRSVDISKFRLVCSDLKKKSAYHDPRFERFDLRYGVDFTKLPFKSSTFDHVVFDPPYSHNPGQMMVDKTYNNKATTKGMYHADIMNLYKAGMKQGVRVLRCGGFMWVKCRDEIETSIQRWAHREVYDIAIFGLGLVPKDLFILRQASLPTIQHKKQKHARKNHSYLWLFRKPNLTDKIQGMHGKVLVAAPLKGRKKPTPWANFEYGQ